MARTTNYQGKAYTEDEKISLDKIKSKVNKEPLTLKELAIYLSNFGNSFDENGVRKNVDVRTLTNYIDKICTMSDGQISKESFKKGRSYLIQPEYHGFLLVLFDNNTFDTRQNDRKVSYRKKIFKSTVNNINEYLVDSDKSIVKESSLYINELIESELTNRLIHILSSLMKSVFHADPMIRYQIMEMVISDLSDLESWISKENGRIWATKLVYGYDVEDKANGEDKNGSLQKKLFQAKDLDELILSLLACKVNNEEISINDEDKKVSAPAFYLAKEIYNFEVKSEDEVFNRIEKLDKEILNEAKYKEIEEKAKNILNLDDPYEYIIYQGLISLSKSFYIKPILSSVDYEITKKFIEESIAMDMWDLLSVFWEMGKGKTDQKFKNRMKMKRDMEFSHKDKEKIFESRKFVKEKY